MAVTLNKYSNATLLMATGRLDLRSTDIKLMLITSDYVPNMDTHSTVTDVSGYELDEYDIYTVGGLQITGLTVTKTGAVVTMDGNSVNFEALAATFKYGVIYLNATVGTGGDEVVKPLIALVDFDDTSTVTSITVSGVDFLVLWNASGIIDFGSCADVCS